MEKLKWFQHPKVLFNRSISSSSFWTFLWILYGKCLFPSVVAFCRNGQTLVGVPAVRKLNTQETCFFGSKFIICLKFWGIFRYKAHYWKAIWWCRCPTVCTKCGNTIYCSQTVRRTSFRIWTPRPSSVLLSIINFSYIFRQLQSRPRIFQLKYWAKFVKQQKISFVIAQIIVHCEFIELLWQFQHILHLRKRMQQKKRLDMQDLLMFSWSQNRELVI